MEQSQSDGDLFEATKIMSISRLHRYFGFSQFSSVFLI